MNKIGQVTGVCNSLTVNPLAGEFIRSIVIRYDTKFIDAISVSSSAGKTIFKGNFPSFYTDKLMTFTSKEPLVGFFGSDDSTRIFSVGEVVVQPDCVVAADPFVTPISSTTVSNDWKQDVGLGQSEIIYLAAATTMVVLIVISVLIAVSVGLKRKQRKQIGIIHRNSI